MGTASVLCSAAPGKRGPATCPELHVRHQTAAVGSPRNGALCTQQLDPVPTVTPPPVSCRESPRVPDERLPELLAPLPMWALSPDKASIKKAFVAKNFVAGSSRGQELGGYSKYIHPGLAAHMAMSRAATNGVTLIVPSRAAAKHNAACACATPARLYETVHTAAGCQQPPS